MIPCSCDLALSDSAYAGEFGIVYKGYLAGQYIDEVVAIKTLKGIQIILWYTSMKAKSKALTMHCI